MIWMPIQKEMHSERDPLRDLKFYSGDVRDEDPCDPLFSDSKAYVTLNALLFDGIETEQARVKEGRRLNPSMIVRYEDTAGAMQGILSCMKPCEQETVVYRVERLVDFHLFCRAGTMTSFISCSDGGFLNSYTDKADLVFLEIHVKPGVLCIHLEDVLEDYLKKDEHELLIGPYCPIQVRQIPVPEEYGRIQDRNGNPVRIYAQVEVFPASADTADHPVKLNQKIIESACRVIMQLNREETVHAEDLQSYLSFKKQFQYMLKK